jgi:acetate kinase
MMRSLRDVIPFAPLHLPLQIQAIERFAQRFPEVPQIACFDTAFHRGMPDVARMFPLPRQYWDRGLLRYGFHGLSFEYVVSTLGASLGPRAIIAHLGAGSSMVALRNGASVDTTMGLTPTSGIMMGTRTGDLDPGLLLYLMRMENFTPDRLDQLVNRESGLLGVSGSTSDMKTLVERSSEDLHAAQAVDMFCLHARRQIGALTATLGGLDTLVFTGGIGEKSPQVRAEICQELQFLGIALDPELNSHSEALISPPASPCTVRVLPTNEEIVLARHAADLFREWPLNCSSS